MKTMKTMKKRKTMKKIIALLMTVIIVICSLPMTAFANTLESTFLESENEAVNEGNENWHLIDEQEIVTDEIIGSVSEVDSLREENVKHFRLSDGTYEAIIYSQPVHRKDKEGVWQDIDNTIELTADAKVSRYATQDLRVSFADRFSNNTELFTLSENGYSISMKLLSNGDILDDEMETTDFGAFSTPTVNNISKKRTSTVFNSIDEAKKIDNQASIVYNNIRNNTNIEYVLNGNDVKENIIVTAPCESYEYVFEITFDGLFAELEANGEISVKDNETDEIKYVIPAPYMYDANGTYSYDVSYTLEQVKDEIYLLLVSADSEWINAEDRAFPVVIDPTFKHYTTCYDSYIDANEPDENFGYEPIMWVSDYCGAFIQMALPELPEGSTLNAAYLNVPYYYHITSGYLLASVYKVNGSWSESTITCNNFPSIGSKISSDMMIASENTTESNPGTASFTITSLVNQWYSGTPNYGVMIMREASSVATNQSVIFKSYEAYAEPTYISIDYTYYLPDGVYALQNDLYYNQWMSIENDGCWDGNRLQQEYSDVSPFETTELDRSRLFKITRIPGTPRYTIRSMLNNTISFVFAGDKIITKEISAFDESVPNSNTFSIEWYGNSFLIYPYGSSYVIGTTSESNANLAPVLKSNASAASRWCLERYTGTHKYGYELFTTEFPFIVGETATFIAAVWSTKIGYNYPVLYVPDDDSTKISFEWNTGNRSAAVEFLSSGQITVGCRIYDQNEEDYHGISARYNILPIKEGTYYIQNAQTQKYVIEEGFSSYAGGIVSQDEYNGGVLQQWEIRYVSGLYLTIKSVTNNMYLGVDPNDSTNIIQCATVDNYCTWKIELTRKRNFKFICKAFENSADDLVLSVDSNENGAYLTQASYHHDSVQKEADYDEWYVVRQVISIVNYYDASFENDETLKSYITEAVEFANLSYSRYFHVGIYMDGAATRKQTILDNCNKDDLNDPCDSSCGSDCSNSHHKNTVNVSDYLYNNIQRQSNHIYVLWTDRPGAYCIENTQHTPKGSVALVYDHRPIIHFLFIPSSTQKDTKNISMALTLVHEIAHVFGLEEMYENSQYPNHDTQNKTTCVMEYLEEEFYADFCLNIANNNEVGDNKATNNTYSHYEPFCKICKPKMREYTSNINIQ